METIFQNRQFHGISQSSSSETSGSPSDSTAAGVTPDNGLANSSRPLPIARNQSDTITSDVLGRAERGCSALLYAPHYAPRSTTFDQSEPFSSRPQVVCYSVDYLRPHPIYARHKLSVDLRKLSALADRGDQAFRDPITITRDRIIVDGYARWELAKRTGRRTLDCFEYDLSSEEALEELIRTHGASRGLTDFVRIELALDLEPHFQERALINQQAGGESKGLSKLTTAQRVDTRREVARVAGVSSGNVRKVKNILARACSSLVQAARIEEVSINLADKWCLGAEAEQQQRLRLRRMERGIKRKARNLVAAHLAQISPSAPNRDVIKLSELVGLVNDRRSVEVVVVDAPGRTILATRELIHWLTREEHSANER